MPRKPDKQIMCGSNFAAAGKLMAEVAHGTQLCAANMSDEQIDEVTEIMADTMDKVENACHDITELTIGDT